MSELVDGVVLVVPCPQCRGTGEVWERPCSSCKGEAVKRTNVRKLPERSLRILELLAGSDAALPAARIAHELNEQHSENGGWGRHGRGNVARRMSEATIVTPAITGLRNRGLIRPTSRGDGLSGQADAITDDGHKVLAVARGLGRLP